MKQTKSMRVGILNESFPGERRVALVPSTLDKLSKLGFECILEARAGESATFRDTEYSDKGAQIVKSRAEVFSNADIVVQVRAYGANLEAGRADLKYLRPDLCVIGFSEPLTEIAAIQEIAATGVTLFAMELIPRISRAQGMDALSSMATVAGYKAVLLAADRLPRMFPMMMTAAGTIMPARVLVVGAGVAGLQAIATSRRLGAVVKASDVRPAVKEQVESLGAKFVEVTPEKSESRDDGSYAKQMSEEFYLQERELLARAVADSDVVITTAAVPGVKAPELITRDMVRRMRPGSVIVDLAAERGGNCVLTRAAETVVEHGITILGPVNLPATVPYHASQMYAKNVVAFLQNIVKEESIRLDTDDEIVRETMVTRNGKIVHPKVIHALQPDFAIPGSGR